MTKYKCFLFTLMIYFNVFSALLVRTSTPPSWLKDQILSLKIVQYFIIIICFCVEVIVKIWYVD